MNSKYYVGKKAMSLEQYKPTLPISKVILWVDDENYYEAGNDTGTIIEQDCPYATQAMANNLLASLGGYIYKPIKAGGAKITPLAELGDGITANGTYAPLAYQDIRFSSGAVADIAAPGSDETLHEYMTDGEVTTQFNRKLAQTRSLISKTSEEILLEISDLASSVSSISTKLDSITLSVTNGLTSSTIKLMAGETQISSENITFSGFVTFSGLSGGTTTVDGSCIQTGTINAERINLTGAIAWSSLTSGVQSAITGAQGTADVAMASAANANDALYAWTYSGSTYIDGSKIMTGTVEASSLVGGEVYLRDSYGLHAASFQLEGASSYSGTKIVITSGAIELDALFGAVYMSSRYGVFIACDDTVSLGGTLHPSFDGGYDCGQSGRRWNNIYAISGLVSTSDKTQKHDISYSVEQYNAFFDALKPVSYKLNMGKSNRTHTGLIAQDVEESLTKCNLTSLDFAGFVKSPRLDESGHTTGECDYALRYDEFIPLCIDQIQKLKQRVVALEGKNGY